MRVLVTGASGLLGSDLFQALHDRFELIGWAHQAPRWPAGWAANLEAVDLTDPAAVRKSLERWKPAVVIHTAAMTDVDASERDPDLVMRVNRDGTRAVAEACDAVRAFLAAVSTDYVFDGTLDRPYREEDAPRPLGHYGRSKLAGEEAALTHCRRTLVVRVSGLFGRYRDNFVSTTASRLEAGEPVSAVTDQVYSPSYTVDLAEGFGRILAEYQRDSAAAEPGGRLHGFLHLSNAGGASRVEVAEWVAERVQAPVSLIRRCRWADLKRPAPRPAQTTLDCGRYRHLTGVDLRSWKEAIRVFLEEP